LKVSSARFSTNRGSIDAGNIDAPAGRSYQCHMSEIIFEVQEDAADGGFVATALGHAIVTQGETLEELRAMVRDAVNCHFGDDATGPMPKIIRLHFVRDEVLAA
jgi:predicted RNase H-like HicB family nuclease